jgi:acyl carrier protein
VIVDRLPLTGNGKVDRAALPAAWEPRSIDDPPVPPRDELETRLVQMWSDLLGVDQVGVEDNFFELGGDSLSSVGLLSLLTATFDLNLTVGQLLDNQTVAELARAIAQALLDETLTSTGDRSVA